MELRLTGFTKRFGPATVIDDMSLTVGSGEMVALLGPSGCGKSTTLFAICGIHRMDAGQLHFGDRDVTELPAQKRPVGVVFQNYALYPHMTAAQNIGFPLRVQRLDRVAIEAKVRAMADLVQIGALLDRKPAQLSGGQQQRVALARALVRQPGILLLDEPLANLDAKLRLEMRSEIRRIQRETGITAILVTHDQVEAMSMCDRIVLMDQGRIVQEGTPAEMYDAPVNRFVAGFLGNPPISFLPAVIESDGLRIPGGPLLALAAGSGAVGPVTLGIRPEHFGPQHGPGLGGQIVAIEPQGREDMFAVALSGGESLRAILPAHSGFVVGQSVDWGVDSRRVMAFDQKGVRL
jgi:inositol-phosphate transport system ATP-binding protein